MSLPDWLQEQQLGHLEETLRKEGVDLDVLPRIDEATLAAWGLVWGDRHRLLAAIQNRSRDPNYPTKRTGPERRQLTVFFSDMVGSTALSTRIEPEEFREAIDRYIHAVNDAVAPYEGYIAKYMGDGILVYFGYPQAHEDDPARAVFSALRAVKAVAKLRLYNGESLQTRVGIATGVVIIDETGAGTAAAETAATGQTMNLAARLQACAEPDEVVIADETRRRLGEGFTFEALKDLELRGFSEKITAWKVSEPRIPSEGAGTQQVLQTSCEALLGRDEEQALLWERWIRACNPAKTTEPPDPKARVRSGRAQTVLLTGEPGVGKSTLTRALAQRVAADGGRVHLWKASTYFTNAALHPVIDALVALTEMGHHQSPEQRSAALERYAEQIGLNSESRAWLAKALGLLRDPNLEALPASEQKRYILAAIRAWLEAASRQHPLLLLIEDAHHLDPSTEEAVASLSLSPIDAPLLLIVTSRAQYQPGWSTHPWVDVIRLQGLSERVAEGIVARITAGRSLPTPLRNEIFSKARGNPLFVEEITRSVLDSGLLIETAQGFELRGDLSLLGVPNTLQDSLMARLDRMGPYKEVAQVASVIGSDFSQRVLSYVLSTRPPQMLNLGLAALVDAGLLMARSVDGIKGYVFRHPLIRDTAYESLVKSQRAMRHWQVAKALEVLDPAAVRDTPELLAIHHQEAGLYLESVRYWSLSGEKSCLLSAHIESAKSFRQGIALLSRLQDEPDCTRLEFDLQMRLGAVLMDAEGFHSQPARAALQRAIGISRALGNPDSYIEACASVSGTLQAKGDFQEVVRLLESVNDRELSACTAGNRAKFFTCLGVSKAFLGTFYEAHDDLNRALQLSLEAEAQVKLGNSPSPLWSIPTRAYAAKVLAYRGLLDRAQRTVEEAYQLSLESKHAMERLSGAQLLVWIRLLAGRLGEAQTLADTLYQQAAQVGIKVRLAGAMAYLGELALSQGEVPRGSSQLEEAYELLETYSGSITLPEFAIRAADALVRAEQHANAQGMLERVAHIPLHSGRAFVQVEYLRLSGRLAQAHGRAESARTNFMQAIRMADQQGSTLFGLRAASTWLEFELGPEPGGKVRREPEFEAGRGPRSDPGPLSIPSIPGPQIDRDPRLIGEPLRHLQRYLSEQLEGSDFPDVLKARKVLDDAVLRMRQ
jgi:class 3 adenylate cyclase/ABC-type transport system involved in cytochrome c biogenesis ATPase subunit